MTFTIPPFWCGVIATLGVEFVIIIGIAIKQSIDKKRNSTFRRK